jgi:hypothetical protein
VDCGRLRLRISLPRARLLLFRPRQRQAHKHSHECGFHRRATVSGPPGWRNSVVLVKFWILIKTAVYWLFFTENRLLCPCARAS